MSERAQSNLEGIAIIGMAGRFPGARNVEEFWRNQLAGVEAISHFRPEELEVRGAAELAKNPDYVCSRSVLRDVELFDAEFFGMLPREAELTDPQQRLFLECCWEAFEDAGWDPGAYAGSVGVYAGSSVSTYFLSRLCGNAEFIARFTGGYQVGNYPEMMGNNLDFLATRVSYKLNLRGPSFTMQAGCSTSLLAVTQACQSLLTYQCDMALAGGVSITFPQKRGSFYQDGGMISPDGHCRTFDADAQGTVFGGGVAVVLLKRAEDAIHDGDRIYAVIRGFAVNNDGSAKVGYTAPSVSGQASVIAMAHEAAGVHPDTIGYLEAHGTGTPLGDPIELAAATKAFRAKTARKQFCVIGTAKTNIGHLDIAAGVTGLIHATHITRRGIFPPTLHFRKPNPQFDLENSPFLVRAERGEWAGNGSPRRAGVSAFGVGGTNAHVVIEQMPEARENPSRRPVQLLPVSARTEAAACRAAANLAAHLKAHPDANLADVAWTLQTGRRAFAHRRAIVTADASEAAAALEKAANAAGDGPQMQAASEPPEVCFMFPGQGSQHPNMAREIYESEPVFREAVDRCAAILKPLLHEDLRELLYPAGEVSDEAKRRVTETIIAQPAIFTVEYALAQLWMSWGIRPAAMIGHSIGEFVAACLAEVVSLEDALGFVAARGKLMQQLPSGGMLSVRLPEAELHARLNGHLQLAAVNGPSLCVVAGPMEALERFEQQLGAEGVACRRLVTSHAFHSAMVEPAIAPLEARAWALRLAPPKIAYVSGVSGNWITESEATNPGYWARHSREPVQFSKGVTELRKRAGAVLLEVGPGTVLTTLARQHPGAAGQTVLPSLGDGFSGEGDARALFGALGKLWSAGGNVDWKAVHAGEHRQKVSLPTYPFERKRYWLEPPSEQSAAKESALSQPRADRNVRRGAEVPDPAQHAKNKDIQTVTATSHAQTQPIPASPKETGEPEKAAKQAAGENGSAAANRRRKIRAAVAEILEDLSGMELAEADGTASFLELGFDSLFLTQVTQALQSQFGVKITFRQLMGDLGTLDALVAFVNGKLPADAFAEAEPQAIGAADSVAVAAGNAAAGEGSATDATIASAMSSREAQVREMESGSAIGEISPREGSMSEGALERLMREQLAAMNQLFAKQLEIARGATAAPVSAPLQTTMAAGPAPIAAPQTSAAPAKITAAAAGNGPGAARKEAASTIAAAENDSAKELKAYTPFRALQTSSSGDLDARQREYIHGLIERYTKRTAGSKQRTQEYRGVLADPRVVAGFRAEWKEMIYPVVTVRSQGARLWDVDGNEYIDILNGFGPIMLGHRPEFVERAIEKQLREGFEIGPQTLLAGEVAKMICEFTGNERATFCNTGSEAVIAAMRIARTVTGRNKVVFFAGDYHGMFDEVLVKGFLKRGAVPHAVPVAPGIPREKAANVVVLEYGTPESLEWIRLNARDLAAVMVEPVQSRHPNLQPVEFLRALRRITEEADTCLIFDEVVTGFRVHPGGCQALFDIRADLATYGKVLAGGMPIGVLAGKAKYMDALDGGTWQFGDDSYPSVGVTFFAGTFVRHPLTLAAAKSVLEHLKSEGAGLQQALSHRTAEMVHRLNEIFEKNAVPSHIENFASIFYFSFPSDFRFGSLFYYSLREKGIHLLEGFPSFLTTAHSQADIEKIVRAFQETVAEMQAGGILPEPAVKAEGVTARAPSTVVTGEPEPRPATAVAVQTEPIEAPMTEAQLEVWLSDQLGEDASCSYNESFTLRLRGRLNEEAFRGALRQLMARHDALRATFDSEGKSQRIAPKLELPMVTLDLSHLDATEREANVGEIIERDARTPFKLAEGPLVRAQLLRISAGEHLLIFTSHHIVCDGWSTNVLLGELSELYNAAIKGNRAQLDPAMSFAEYAHSQKAFFEGAEGATNEKYWLEEFGEPAPLLDLPIDRPRPGVKEFRGATHRKRIGAEAYNRIKKAGARQKCTLFVTLLAGFQALLARLSGQDDIVVGIPSAGQSLVEGAVLVGHCVNFLPLRARAKLDAPAAEFLAEVKRKLLAAYDHQNYTYGRLVRKLSIRRDPSRLPLTEVQFNLEKVGEGLAFDELDTDVDPNPKSFVNFDIFLNVVETKEGLILDCDYNTGLYDESTIARWMDHYETLLEGIARDAERPLGKLPLLNDRELHRILAEWNSTAAAYPRECCVHHLIEAQAKANPRATAIVFGDDSRSYEQLDQQANQLAAYLRKLGVGPGVRVGVFVERSLEMLIALLGVMKAGGAYVPMDPTYPVERIAYVMSDAGAPVLLTQEKLATAVPAGAARIVCLDAEWEAIAREPKEPQAAGPNPEDLMYVIYTSGSTGRPKGVEIQHRAVVNLLNAMRKRPGMAPDDVLVAVTTLSFDIAGLELYLPLISGAKVVIASRETAGDGGQLLALLRQSGATMMQATPVTWKLLLEAGWDGNPRIKALCGGEAFPRDLANQMAKRAASVWNMYGPTETTIWSAVEAVNEGSEPVPIGPPIDNTQFYVLDARGELCPIGVAGELYIGGDGLARGYFHRGELTAERFVADPFRAGAPSTGTAETAAPAAGARLYKTGDLVRRTPDGRIEFLGRLDNQVKLRGFRIELGEIEAVLGRYPGVKEAVVIVREDAPGDKRLVAYITSDQQAITVTAVREFLTGKLPNYMLPSAVVRLEAMPLTPNGKIDRKALPMPDAARAGREREFVAPSTPEEKLLAEIWAEVLHLDRVGVQDNLFELGADSLHIFQIAARAAKAGIRIAPALFLKHRTITALLAYVRESGNAAGVAPAPAPKIVAVPREKYRVRQVPA